MKTFDVAIVGGGIIGASIAFELAACHLRVVVLDRQQPGQEASWAAAGMLSPAPDSPRDIPLVSLGRESLRLYPAFVSAVEEASGKPTGYARQGALEIFFAPDDEAARDRSVEEHQRLGLAAEPISLDSARRREKAIGGDANSAAWLPEEGTIEPRLVMDAVLTAAERRGVEIRPDYEVSGLVQEGGRCTGVVAGREKIAAGHVVISAGCFSQLIDGVSDLPALYAPTRPVRGQMISLRPEGPVLRHVLRSKRGYLVPRRDGRIAAGSTLEEAGFDKRVTPAGIRKIFEAALELCPALSEAQVLETWSGLRPGTPDDLPIIGPTDIEGLLIATGHYRNGILLAPITAKLMRGWIAGARVDFPSDAFSPLRFAKSELRKGAQSPEARQTF